MSGQSHSLSYVVDVKANIGQIQNIAKQIQSSLNGLTLPKGMFSQFASEFDSLYQNLTKYEQIANKGLPQNKKGMSAANSAWEGVELSIGKIQNMMNQLNAQELKLLPKDAQGNLNKINDSLKKYKSILSEVQQGQTYRSKNDALSKELEKQEALLKRQQELQARITTKTSQQQAAKSQLNQLGISDQDLANYETKILRLEKLQNDLKAATSLKGDKQTDALGKLNFNSLEDAEKKLVEINSQLDLLKNYRKASKGIAADQAEFNFNNTAITKTLEEINKLKTELASLEKTGSGEALNKVLQQIATLTNTDVSKFAGDLKLAEKALENFKSDQLTAAITKLEGVKNQTSSLTATLEQGTRANQQFNNSFNQMLTREQDMANFINRFSYFFSLTGITQTVRRTVRNITTTIKDLDSVMTEAAVVTEFSIGDMWDKLPDYTKKASALGTSIKSLYEATTLYYQQGLGEQAAMDIGVETMKMARIANMDASDATQAMTAALRGFNMEIDKTSATRVNDVYSKLAAITASDTEKIATAMSKTASIASSANMEFETTAAFLAQIIETTQEAPETAGTAMKTIIARFTEVKKMFSEGMLSGEDEEGEAIEINKIDTALKSVGISLKSFLRGEKGIDDIFLELASKWDTLDLATQRYIATTAAGSRQQSRFIAMMSDYGRTMELVDAAQNSTGASQKQFDKTLESLDSKFERMKNAWNEFTMSIVNSDLVKAGIDALTKILDTVNKITNALGKVGSPLAKIGLVLGGFSLGRNLFLRTGAGQFMSSAFARTQPEGQSRLFQGRGPIAQMANARLTVAQEGHALGRNTSSPDYRPYASSGIFGPSRQEALQVYDQGIARLQQQITERESAISNIRRAEKNLNTKNATLASRQAKLNQANTFMGTRTPEQQEEYDKLQKSVERANKNATKAQNGYNRALNKSGLKAEEVGKAEEELANKREELNKAEQQRAVYAKQMAQKESVARASAAGQGAMLLGMGLGLGATAAQKSGNEELAENLSVASNISSTMGMTIMSMASIASALQVTMLPVAAATAAIAAAVGAIALVANAAYQASPEGQLKQAEKRLTQTQQEAAQAATNYRELNESLDRLDEQAKTIDKLTKGTNEWKQSVNENNKEITELVDKYKELSDFVTVRDGVMTIDQTKTNQKGQTVADILREEKVDSIQASNAVLQAQADVIEETMAKNYADYAEGKFIEFDNEVGKLSGAATKHMGVVYDVTPIQQAENATPTGTQGGQISTFKSDQKTSDNVIYTTNQEKTKELAKALASGEITNIDDAIDWAADRGAHIELDQDTLSSLRTYGFMLKSDELELSENKRQQAQGIKDISQLMGSTSEFVQTLGDDFIGALRDSKIDEVKDKYSKMTQENLENYLDMMGYASYEGKDFWGKHIFKKQDGTTTTVAAKDIQLTLAGAQADVLVAQSLDGIQSSVKSGEQEQISQLLSTEGQEVTSEQIKEYIAGDYLTDEGGKLKAVDLAADTERGDAFAQQFTNYDTFQEWANAIDMDPTELSDLIGGNLESAADRIVDERKDLIVKMAKYSQGAEDGQGYDIASTLLTGFEQKFGDKGREMLLDVFSSLEKSGDSELIRNGWAKFMSQALTMSETEAQDLADTISNINWDNPIDAAHSLSQELKTGSASSKEFAQHILQANTAFLGAGSQVRYLLGESEDADAINDELNKIFETHNEITAADIYDLTDQYKSLEKILKNTNVSASALAETLQNVQQEELGLHQITSAVIAAIGSIGSLDDMIAGLNKRLSEFNPGIDENFASEFIGQASEVFSTNLDKGAVGNSQLDRYMDFMFGSEWDSGLDKDARTARLKEAGQFFKKNSQNMQAGWIDMANLMAGRWVGGILGKQFNKDKMDELGFNITRKGSGEIELSGYENLTYEEMAQNMSKVFGITEDMAQMFLTDYANYSGDIKIEEKQRQQSVEDTVQYAQGAAASINGNQVIDQSEIEAIAKLRGLDVNELASGFGAAGYGITNFYDENGSIKSASEAWKEFQRVGGYDSSRFGGGSSDNKALYQDWLAGVYGGASWESISGELPYFDMAALEDELANSGLSEQIQQQIKDGALAGITQSVDESGRATEPYEVQARMSDGSLQNITVEAGKTFEEAYNAAETAQQNDQLAQSLINALAQASASGAEVSIKPIVDTGAIQTQLNGQTYSVSVGAVISLSGGGKITAGPTGGVIAMGQKPHIGPSYPAYASGLQSAKRTHAALTGELGPELIWRRSRNEFYLSGTRGPEMTTVHPSDTVYTAEETKKILNRPNGPKMPGFASGVKDPAYSTSYGDATTSGGKSTKKGSKDWENPFDKLYNLVREIDEELRERERIERRYEKLLEDLEVSANKIIDVSRQQLIQLEKERKLQEKLIEGRKEQIDAYQKENEDYKKYASVTYDEMGDALLRINWELIDAIKNAEEGKEVQDYVNQLEEWIDSLTEAEDALWEIEDTIEEIKERGEDTYFDLEGKIKDAVEKSYQDQIDKLEAINDSINDTNADLLDGIQKTIDKQRQDRENEKVEEELGDKQRRLSYLQMDTSGANAMEILHLQKEIEEGQEDYTNTLIDQKISELQLQNDEAAKQREKQIELLQAQLDNYLDTGRIWNEVYQLMDEGLDKDTGLIRGSRLEEILQNEDTFKGLSVIGKQEWWVDMDKKVAEALSYLEIGRQIENLGVKNKEIEFFTEDGQKLKGKVDDKGNVTTADGTMYNNVYQGANGLYYAGKNYETPKEPEVEEIGTGVEGSEGKQGDNSQNNPGGTRTWKATASYTHFYANGTAIASMTKTVTATSTKSWKDADEKAKQLAKEKGLSTFASAKKQAEYNLAKSKTNFKEAQMEAGKRYATGGLADFTGPAWLDGTKSRPELVLNQRDTQNFLQLKDILSSIFSNGTGSHSSSTENNGDITYDIDINVESISSDYDIDRVASRVKTLITEDARYRNNNSVSLKR